MASQWPKPEGFDSDIDPLDLVDRFKEHYLSICRYTADNPTATAPASYVMDVMFQANKVVAMLAKNMSSVSKVCSSEVAPEPEQPPTNQLNLQDRLAVLSNMFQVNQQEQGPAEDPLACEDDVDALAQELSTKDILGPDLNPEDSEEDEDWESESSEDDSDDDYYEYGSFADESEEEDVAADEVESEGEHQNNVDEQGSYGDDSEEGYEEENEVESEGEHQNNSDEQDDTPDDVSKGEQQIKEELEDERDYEMRCAESNDDECDTTAHSESCEEYGITPSEVDEFSEQAMSVQGGKDRFQSHDPMRAADNAFSVLLRSNGRNLTSIIQTGEAFC
jgi:cobalamin biosynthesis protein CobT